MQRNALRLLTPYECGLRPYFGAADKRYSLERTRWHGMAGGSWYNGYNPKERLGKMRVMNRLLASGKLPPATGPCALCGDPDVPVEYHDEDYGEPYLWGQPSQFCLCRHCHRHKLHTRFNRPSVWYAYLAHIRRGGHASHLKDPEIKAEFDRYRVALERGETLVLRPLQPYAHTIGDEWFAALRMDIMSLEDA
jgi:hypothetical protein